MPTYEYACRACGAKSEAWRWITEPDVMVCPECGAADLVRLIGAGGAVIFRGPGFHATDYGTREGGSRRTDGK